MDTSSYRNFVRMDSSTFEELLSKVAPKITYQNTVMREAISAGERLAVTLRFLATGNNKTYKNYATTNLFHCTGETFASLQYLYRIPAQTIGRIIPDTCRSIVNTLSEDFLKVQ